MRYDNSLIWHSINIILTIEVYSLEICVCMMVFCYFLLHIEIKIYLFVKQSSNLCTLFSWKYKWKKRMIHMSSSSSYKMEKHIFEKDLRRRPFINERIIFHDHELFVCLCMFFVRSCSCVWVREIVATCHNNETVNK